MPRKPGSPTKISLKVRRLLRRNAVFMALHILADRDGLGCDATNGQIAKSAGLTAENTVTELRGLEFDGMIQRYGLEHNTSCRIYALMTHPGAERFARQLQRKRGMVRLSSFPLD